MTIEYRVIKNEIYVRISTTDKEALLKLTSITQITKFYDYISIYSKRCPEDYLDPIVNYYYKDKKELEKDYQNLLFHFKHLGLVVRMIHNGNGFYVGQEEEVAEVGENFIGEYLYKGNGFTLHSQRSIILVNDISAIKKCSPYVLCLNLSNDELAYWVYCNSCSADKKYNEIKTMLSERG